MNHPTYSRRRPCRPQGGFSFIELIVVMGAMGMLMGLAVGYLNNIGQATFIMQARSMLSETAYRCINASSGGRRAILTLREVETDVGGVKLRVGAQVSGTVLTHQFETLDFASEGRSPGIHGRVEIKRGGGRVGNCALFQGGYMEFPAASDFAMTEGIQVDVWVQPAPAGRLMSIVKGEEAYEVMLVQKADSNAYDIRLSLTVRKVADNKRTAPIPRVFETRGGVVVADGRWSRIQVDFDGIDATMRVNGLEVYAGNRGDKRTGEAEQGEALKDLVQRIVVPSLGAVKLTIGSGERPYKGLMDSLHLRGVFRSEELERDLPGQPDLYEVLYPTLPLRMYFFNGGLDPDKHSADQIVRISDRSTPEDAPMRLTVGMYGVVSSIFEKPGEGGPVAAKKPGPKKARSP